MDSFKLLSNKTVFARGLGREFFWVGLGQALAIIGSLVGVRLLTGRLSPDTYGELALGMTVAGLVNQIILGPLNSAAMRFFSPAQESGSLLSFLNSLRNLLIWATIAIFLIACVSCLALLLTGHLDWIWLSVAAFGFALLAGYNSTLDGLQNAARHRVVVAWHQGVSTWVKLLVVIGLITILAPSSEVAMSGYLLASGLVLGSQIWFFYQGILKSNNAIGSISVNNQLWGQKIITYALPFMSWGLFSWLQQSSDRWVLQFFSTTYEVGLYAVLNQLGYQPIILLTGLIVQLVSPVFFQKAGDATDLDRVKKVLDLNSWLVIMTIGLTFCAVLAAWLFHDWIFSLFVAPDFYESSWLLPGIVLSGGLFAAGQIASLSFMSSNETRRLIIPKIATSLTGLLLNCIGAAKLGLPGVVAASIAFSLFYLLWIVIILRTKPTKNSMKILE